MKTLQRKIIKVLLCFTLILPGMFSPFTCPGFSFPVFNLLTTVKAEEDPGTTTATNTGIAALIAILMASGIRFVGDYETVVKPAVTNLWEDFSSYAGNQLSLAQLGAGIAISQGYLRVNSSVNNAVVGFQSWYQNTFNVPNTGSVTVSTTGGTGSYFSAPAQTITNYMSYGNYTFGAYVGSGSDVRGAIFSYSGMYAFYLISRTPFTFNADVTSNLPGTLRNATTRTSGGVTYYANYTSGFSYSSNGVTLLTNSTVIEGSPNFDTLVSYTFGNNAVVGDLTLEGQSYELKDGYQLDNDQAKLLDLASLAALAAALGLALENVTDLVNDIPLIYGYPWAQDFPDVYPNTPADTIPWVDTPTSVIPAEVPEYVPTTPSGTDSYKVLGLERVFPFSIPFDLIALVRVLNAEPVTPSFTFKLYDPYRNRNVSQNVTLEQFSSIAAVFRVGVVLLFLAALIKLTRILIRG